MRLPFEHDPVGRGAEFRHAFRFLTRVPLGGDETSAAAPLAAAGWAFPIVGALVGLGCGIVYWIATELALPPLAAALITIGAGVLLTGGLHEDGLADTADGLGGGADAAAKLAIMRDSRSGTYGVLALIFSVGLRATAIGFIGGRAEVLAALIAAHAVGRGALPVVLAYLSPARDDGLGASAGRTGGTTAAWSAGIAIVLTLLLLGLGAAVEALITAALVMALVATLARRQIGGHTGDVLGAIEQMGETVVLLVAAAWMV